MNAYLTWFKAHERLLTIALLLVGAFALTNRVLDSIDARKAAVATKAEAQVTTDTSATTAILSTLKAQQEANDQAFASFSADIQQLQKQQAASAAAIQQAPAPVVAKSLGGSAPDDSTVVLPLEAARTADTAEALLPIVQKQLADDQTQLASLTTLVATQETAIADLQKELADTKTADAAQISELKTRAKKNWLHGFKWGLGVGFAAGAMITHAL